MLLKPTTLFTMLFLGVFLHAQEVSVKGKVFDADDAPLSFVNVILLKASDSTAITGTSTQEQGIFQLNNVKKGEYLLQATHIGYKTSYQTINLVEDTDIGTIFLSPEAENLEGVTVAYQQPTIEKKGGRLVFQVENTTLSSLSTYEILQRTPGVITTGNRILVKNAKTTVYINDKRVYLEDSELQNLLQNFSGSNIASIEVITNPSAKYDAEGGSVLNIVTSKTISIGYKGSVNGKYTQAVFPKYAFGTDHYYKNDVLNIYAGYTFSPRKEYKRDDSYIHFFDGTTPSNRWETDMRKITRSKAYNFNTIWDFTIDEKNELSFTSNLSFNPNQTIDNKFRTDVFDQNGTIDSAFVSQGDMDIDNVNLAFNASYKRAVGENGASLKAESNYVYFSNEQQQNISTDYYNNTDEFQYNNTFNTDADQKNNIFTAQADYNTPWGDTDVAFGVKYSGIESHSTILFDGTFNPEQSENDDFEYNENIWAVYADMSKSWEKWTLQTGLRGEQTDVRSHSLALGQGNNQGYFELFPTVSLHNTLSDKHQWGINYKRAIARPRYQSLNPFRYYLNEKNYFSGNPYLGPAIENKFTLDYTYNGNYIFEIYYQHFSDELIKLTFQDNEAQAIYNSTYNITESFQYSIDFIHYRSVTPWWFLSTYMSGFFYENSFTAIESGNALQTLNTYGYFGQLYNAFTLSKDRTFTADLYLEYLSSFIAGNYMLKNRFKANIGLKKSLWNKRAELSLNIADVFNSFNVLIDSRYLNQDHGYTAMPESRSITLGFRYKFGNYRLEDNERDIELDEQERLEEEDEI
ncbi:outer membrane beta-barrel family protein [Galbibacter sp. EGI 63066]|uniref:outer membrane beta-barrel protein n=1 Tax=Galbibacter sp. EGI 63066 TaxID=2993559 RepID=UPI0022489595|nr:outer membrane beta-barrel family protein [Galbibacter sp. EGI 63066]MCX2679030.1 outer membrane beta-barrel family protein [Galbibacter sp. EGI 63066]